EREFGFDIDADLIDRLAQDLVIHNWPPHPLGVPLLCTIWIGYTGERSSMSAKLDKIMQAAAEVMSHPIASTHPASGLVPRLLRTPDGIWYVQLGLIGPALGVANDWLVVSYSRESVRQNLDSLARRSSTQPH